MIEDPREFTLCDNYQNPSNPSRQFPTLQRVEQPSVSFLKNLYHKQVTKTISGAILLDFETESSAEPFLDAR